MASSSHRQREPTRFVVTHRADVMDADVARYTGSVRPHPRFTTVDPDTKATVFDPDRVLMDGRGTATMVSGDVYVGDVSLGMFEGTGRMQYADGAVYDGTWKGSLRDGYGVYESAGGHIQHTGRYKGGDACGQGEWARFDLETKQRLQETYIGMFRDGVFDGIGRLRQYTWVEPHEHCIDNARHHSAVDDQAVSIMLVKPSRPPPPALESSGHEAAMAVAMVADPSHVAAPSAKSNILVPWSFVTMYDGVFRKGKLDGRVTVTYSSGNVCVLTYADGLPHGSAVFTDIVTGERYLEMYDHGVCASGVLREVSAVGLSPADAAFVKTSFAGLHDEALHLNLVGDELRSLRFCRVETRATRYEGYWLPHHHGDAPSSSAPPGVGIDTAAVSSQDGSRNGARHGVGRLTILKGRAAVGGDVAGDIYLGGFRRNEFEGPAVVTYPAAAASAEAKQLPSLNESAAALHGSTDGLDDDSAGMDRDWLRVAREAVRMLSDLIPSAHPTAVITGNGKPPVLESPSSTSGKASAARQVVPGDVCDALRGIWKNVFPHDPSDARYHDDDDSGGDSGHGDLRRSTTTYDPRKVTAGVIECFSGVYHAGVRWGRGAYRVRWTLGAQPSVSEGASSSSEAAGPSDDSRIVSTFLSPSGLERYRVGILSTGLVEGFWFHGVRHGVFHTTVSAFVDLVALKVDEATEPIGPIGAATSRDDEMSGAAVNRNRLIYRQTFTSYYRHGCRVEGEEGLPSDGGA